MDGFAEEKKSEGKGRQTNLTSRICSLIHHKYKMHTKPKGTPDKEKEKKIAFNHMYGALTTTCK